MCGIFGLVLSPGAGLPAGWIRRTVERLMARSESRGKEASGLALALEDRVEILKAPIPARRLRRTRAWTDLWRGIAPALDRGTGLIAIGHARLVTDGGEGRPENNHPVLKDGVVCIHNGIVVNADRLWRSRPGLERRWEVDTEVLASLVRSHLAEGRSPPEALVRTYEAIEGTASIALLLEDREGLFLATNNGSLYVAASPGVLLFASERPILDAVLADRRIGSIVSRAVVEQVAPRTGRWIDERTAAPSAFSLRTSDGAPEVPARSSSRAVRESGRDLAGQADHRPAVAAARRVQAPWTPPAVEGPGDLRRCTRCVLPETHPFVEFDAEGVCRYCRSYSPLRTRGPEALRELADRIRSPDGRADCIVAYSGGRDSSYVLHYVRRELGLHPIAYTYDWGMVTDLARRNQARMCGRLGVEHVLISADIPAKREAIRKNVAAWLRKPDLGVIPLFMAGDKMFFWQGEGLRRRYGVETVFFGLNELENEDFKVGFCGIRTTKKERHQFFDLDPLEKVRLLAYYGRRFLANPGYLNSSIPDTLFAFWCYYVMSHEYYCNLFSYVRWDEAAITETLRREYDWEFATDTVTSWRIGDGTAAFYNYIYWRVAGLTEHDAFRANQVREGVLTREEALERTLREGLPRLESIREYCDLVGLDFREAIEAIERIPRRYRNRKEHPANARSGSHGPS